MYYYEIVHIKISLGYLWLQFISDFYPKSIDLSKIINIVKNSDPSKKSLNKISFIYYYKIVYTKQLLGHL